ncbi:M14 family metallopeptidase [Postechiella marina]|uniref:M14 family metallopeptidase n=1 Tax=Postechiella marina TaxID=943941 RepID=A0ABP8C196_9FLAO
MEIKEIQSQFKVCKETSLYHRYITNTHIEPLLEKLSSKMEIKVIGTSVLNQPIHSIKIGQGDKKVLMWSQMHGNESTTTKAIFDLLNTLTANKTASKSILEHCTLYIIPILNPDGAKAYTRINANKVDLNRDAQALSQPESKVLRAVFNEFKPHFCLNLHGQRTIFSAGETNNIATVSFLSPAQDKACTITANRKVAMEVIAEMNSTLQYVIPNQVGVYDDAFNINCVGDTFQSENVPTILFEAGHFKDDYGREVTREYIYMSLWSALKYIANNDVSGAKYEPYLNIPENGKCFLDVIIRNASIKGKITDVGFLFKETLINNKIEFIPKVERLGNLNNLFGHKEIDAKKESVLCGDGLELEIGSENVCVSINNAKIALFQNKSHE